MMIPGLQKIYHEKINLTGKFCFQPWENININNDGSVYSCYCQDWTSLRLGNILDNPLEEIYSTSENLKKIRDSVLHGKFAWCKVGHCSMLDSLSDIPDNIDTYKKFTNFSLPTTIHLGIDDNCNLKCASCRSGLIFKNEENPTTEKILQSLCQSYRNFDKEVQIFCDGSGDLFTSKSWEKFIYGTEIPPCWKLVITTNGNLLSKRRKQLESIKHNIYNVIISLDAGSYDTYKRVRGGDWDVVIDGIEIIKELDLQLNFQFVLQRENYLDLLNYKEIANKYNVSYGLQLLDKRQHMTSTYWNYNCMENNPDINYEILAEYLQILKQDKSCSFDGGIYELFKKLHPSH